MQRKFLMLLVIACMSGSTSACDLLGLGDDAEMTVQFAGINPSGQTLSSVLGDGAGAMGPISLAAIDSINLSITAIEAVRQEGEGEGEGSENWVRLTLVDEGKARINLMQLPVDDGDATTPNTDAWQLARGEIPAGRYNGVRLRYDVATARITLNREVTVGQQVYAAGQYVLDIPSGEQNGVKVPFGRIEIGEDATANVELSFESGITIQHASATGSGRIMMPPVLKARVAVVEE